MKPVDSRRWSLRREFDRDLVETLGRELGVSPWAARVLAARSVETPEEGRLFLQARLSNLPDPFLLKGVGTAVERLVMAIEQQQLISVHGDYDVDGITGTALLTQTLQSFGGRVEYHIPLRLKDGYGLSAEALRSAAGNDARVVVSVDCGISAHAEAELAAELGLDLIITDHHQPPDSLPRALALVNPHQPGCSFPDRNLCGVGVAFMLLVALRKALRERGWFAQRPEPDLRQQLDLVALGTVADLVPLTGLNRTLVRSGLQRLDQGPRPGIRALKDVAGVREVSAGAVGFRLAPRLNAAGRLEDAALGVELLLTDDADRARELAEQLDDFNQQRQQIEQTTFADAVAQLEDAEERFSIVLADPTWHSGVIGIVASRLVERYGRPTLLIALDEENGKGSGRSVRGFHLYHGLQACADDLLGFGGHEYAAGFSIAADRLDAFSERFEARVRCVLTMEDLMPTLLYEGEIGLDELGMELVAELESLAPFGMGNPEPVLLARNVDLHRVEAIGDGSHLRCVARQGGYSCNCIAFRMAERIEEFCGPCDLLFTPGINEWKGRRSVQLRLRDLRPATSQAEA
ncbi:single-stranded-DNA-specific exonuclease RecJ [Geothermobacter hydrogeniphilus]|uniref:Single-stranded-DNA-specific exonuclease RecJ n=1 Tax=Geothermobacter hydrogeniphilus TaxID=1969733 RepID=A0A2K2HC01_9BACT|nr:single-stranded-DNA-specific exonuclease RecJ [Geothermobacter hydrogeniphilus]PNU20749.1 single-stranded-DNA-specific exonuclease RecJ [Geothermobacter hydrogeniphilus]